MMAHPPSPQAPSEAEAAADLIDMGPDLAAPGNLSSQLAGMSKCGAALQGWGCPPIAQLELEDQQQIVTDPPDQCPTLTLATRLSAWGKARAPQLLALSNPRNATVLPLPPTLNFPWPESYGELGQVT